MGTAPTCPQCGGNGVRTVTHTMGEETKLLWVCELDHRFAGPSTGAQA